MDDDGVELMVVKSETKEKETLTEASLINDVEQKTGLEKTKKVVPRASIKELFMFATPLDFLLMASGILSAVAVGTALPFAMLLFGNITDSFINYQISRNTLEMVNSYNLSTFNDTLNMSVHFALRNSSVNCTLIEPIVQSHYYTSAECITYDELMNITANNSETVKLNIDKINCTTFNQLFLSLYGSSAECLTRSNFISQINSQIINFIIVACATFVLGFIIISSFHLASERQVYKMRLAYYKSVLRQDIAWFDLNPAGEISSRLSDDLDKILSGIGDKLGLLFQWISTFFTGFAIGFVRDWRLTLLLLGLTPLLALGGALLSKAIIYFTGRGQQSYAKAGVIAEEVLSSIRTVIAFGGEFKESARYDKEIKAGRILGAKKGVAIGLSLAYVWFLLFVTYAVAFWFGGWLISEDLAQGGEILTVFFSVIVGAFAIGQALPNLELLSTALGAAGSIVATIKRTPPIDSQSTEGVSDDVDISKIIQFDKVTFNYPARPEIEVLKSFSMIVKSGQTVALVGHSGCGKSTVLQLLQRFYDVTSGDIVLGSHSIKDININYLRENIGVVSQEPVLFDLSIYDNIKFGNPHATTEQIIQSAKDANVHDFIKSLPDAYNTIVGERGTQLSGGQKQRVAIARALVRNPKILLLDEATSALDSESEQLVQAALEKAREGRTTIVIAHRLSTIKNADQIVVLEKGSIVEIGCHGDLMKLEGHYFDMVVAQNQTSVDETFLAMPKAQSRFSRQISEQVNYKAEINTALNTKQKKDELLKKKQADWDKELKSVSFRRVIALNSKEWYLITIGVLATSINAIVFPSFAIIFGEVLLAFSMSRDEVLESVYFPASLFIILAVVSGLANFVKTVCFTLSGELLTERIRSRVFKAMLRQEMGWFDEEKHSTGALTTRLSEDAAQVQGGTGTRLGTIVETFVTLIIALVIAFAYSWILTIVILGFVPFMAIATMFKGILIARQATRNKQSQTEAGKLAVDSIENVRTVTSLNVQTTFVTLYDNEVKKPYKAGLLIGELEGVAYGISQGMIFFGYVIAFRFGAFVVSLDSDHFLHTEYQNVFRVLFALVFGALAIGQASAFTPNVAKAKISSNRIFSLLDRVPVIDNYSVEGKNLDNFQGDITFDKVSFNYPTRPKVPVLQDVSLNIKPGQTIALVGPSGCGKSTTVSLLERFYDPLSGLIKLDDVPILDLNIRWLRSQLGIVSQEPVLFDDTIAGNIRYGDSSNTVSDEDIIDAAKAANIDEFVKSLPQGYNTYVGDKGTQLSGGQKQRVAIARALVRNPKILLLDEATSALDSESERIVQEALDKAREGRTSLIIAHRLSTIQNADCIVVLTKGQINEVGTHAELLAKHGLYYQLYQHQQIVHKK